VQAGSAAESAGLAANDLIVAVDGQSIGDWGDWAAAVMAAPAKSLELSIKRRGVEQVILLTPAAKAATDGTLVGFAGVTSATRTVRHSILRAMPLAVREVVDKTTSILLTLKKMLTGQVSTRNLSGPITIAQVAGDTVDQGWRRFVGLLALLSLSLAVLNLLPVPMLDGGQIMFFTVELVRGKPLSERTQVIGMQIGLFMVGGLMLLALSNDITRLLGSL
jgi:regulator of sigma E protease